MKSAISVYPGLGISDADYFNYISEAKNQGIELVFMSLHIPEANLKLLEQFKTLLNYIDSLKMKAIIDISKKVYDELDLSSISIYGLRLDYGFSDQEIVSLCKTSTFKIFLNASTIDAEGFDKLRNLGLNPNQIGVFHNFYPKPFSGLAEEYFYEKNKFYKSLGIEVLAFTCSHFKPRLPLFKGLPTIENHRNYDIYMQLNELLMMKVDIACVGDAMANSEELKIMTSYQDNFVKLRFNKINQEILDEHIEILKMSHKVRPDQSLYIIRSESSRSLTKTNQKINPKNNAGWIEPKTVTIDNLNNLRYCGEVNIWKETAKNDGSFNIIGNVEISEWMLENSELIKEFKFILE
ncbi:hypothetical protein SCLARK_001320 [Spiroplasma clarkii]|uniref:Outer surface protein n=1 Tax=Spiroplasma clarkii TaxID=2139 RepID=A0A1Y0L2A3_9MOLU|nr:MupG family TIM beta-alpha barrel fold protein [Spiroplasma clarkii]ARU91855.1 hypothetical protein SCLARK_001320 [Spiroplasma clarkii]ATX71209.1 hypothetical protein SCLAR_v1c09030 [Spiroplasma clarkii]